MFLESRTTELSGTEISNHIFPSQLLFVIYSLEEVSAHLLCPGSLSQPLLVQCCAPLLLSKERYSVNIQIYDLYKTFRVV